jgi:hypothetical protein
MEKMEENLKGNMNKKITKLETTMDQKITSVGQFVLSILLTISSLSLLLYY